MATFPPSLENIEGRALGADGERFKHQHISRCGHPAERCSREWGDAANSQSPLREHGISNRALSRRERQGGGFSEAFSKPVALLPPLNPPGRPAPKKEGCFPRDPTQHPTSSIPNSAPSRRRRFRRSTKLPPNTVECAILLRVSGRHPHEGRWIAPRARPKGSAGKKPRIRVLLPRD
jgi:hypothetical protein